jgi:hypothetical protein
MQNANTIIRVLISHAHRGVCGHFMDKQTEQHFKGCVTGICEKTVNKIRRQKSQISFIYSYSKRGQFRSLLSPIPSNMAYGA